jgi:DNA recombination protein RmuC
MESIIFGVVYLVAGAILGALGIWLLYREKLGNATERGRTGSALELATARERLQALQSQASDLLRRMATVEQERDQIRGNKDALQVKAAELTTELHAEREQASEKIALLSKAKDDLTATFKNLATDIFEDKSKRFTEQNKESLEGLLNPLRERLKDFQKKVEETYDKESKERLTLKGEIQKLAELNVRISADAVNLTKALTGDVKTQGSWGELVLEKVLESSGLRKDEEYIVQGSFSSAEGARLQPDVVVNLPENRQIVIDSKVSLTAYERHSNVENDGDRELALRQHLVSVRAHVRELSEKNYQNLYGINSLDFVLMFIPVESAYMVAVQADRDLFLEALRQNVFIVSPGNLIAILRTVAYIWRQENQNRNAQEIARQCAMLYDKLVGFVEDLEEIGRKLGAALTSFEAAKGKLATGRGNLIRQAERVKALGVKPTKSLPQILVDRALEDDVNAVADEQLNK